jgi:predicted porin
LKRRLRFLAACCACLVQQVHADVVQIWGIAETGVRYSKGLSAKNAPTRDSTLQVLSGAKNVSRWGINVSEDLGGGLNAIVALESGISLDSGSQANATKYFDRASYMGFTGRNWRLTLGRQTTPLADSQLITDPLKARFAGFNVGVQYSALSAPNLGHDYGSSGMTTGAYRLDNSAKLAATFGRVTGVAMVSAGEDKSGHSESGGLTYRDGGLIVSGSAGRFMDATGLSLDAGYLGISYQLNPAWRLAADFASHTGETSFSEKTHHTVQTLGFSHALTPSLDLLAAVSRLGRERTAHADDGFTRVMGFLEYKFSKRTIVFLEADATRWEGDFIAGGDKRGTGLSVGISHRF